LVVEATNDPFSSSLSAIDAAEAIDSLGVTVDDSSPSREINRLNRAVLDVLRRLRATPPPRFIASKPINSGGCGAGLLPMTSLLRSVGVAPNGRMRSSANGPPRGALPQQTRS
jgi:hypothetical protein